MLSNLHPVFQQALMPFLPMHITDPRLSMTLPRYDPQPEKYAQEMLDLLIAIVIENDGPEAENLRNEAFDLIQRAEGRV